MLFAFCGKNSFPQEKSQYNKCAVNAYKNRRIFVFLLLLAGSVYPTFSFADTASVSGGFPSATLWLSKTALTDGDSVEIFAPVYNASDGRVEGDVSFLVDTQPIGSVHFRLDQGETKIVSLSWSAKEGTHNISGKILNATNSDSSASVSLSGMQTEAIQVTVAAPPPPPVIVQFFNSAGSALGSVVSVSLPAIKEAARAVFAAAESVRMQTATALQNSLAKDTNVAAEKSSNSIALNTSEAGISGGAVLGQEISGRDAANLAAVVKAPPFSALRLLEHVAFFFFASAWAFYPLLLLIILAIFYFFAKRIGNPHPVRA
ncbi:MAG: hypothetical protein HY221_00430 [Candidatus Sungbacteria bacterium]|uniref:Uncharacterized protein n=1 Tax=Candidatus Sungiibacteriota bacterium TaxID=2750080 RepID=A0A932VPE7_9BACT|nr:hypothetical protein [Candidatus Sungbacteria bacterium]